MRYPGLTKKDVERRKEWSSFVSDKKKIFLDVNFWIRLRDSPDGELSRLCTALCAEAKTIFPITESVLYEVLKQSDPTTRLQTLTVIDRLSLGAVLVPERHRVIIESSNLLAKYGNRSGIQPITNLLWTKPAYFFGNETIPGDYPSAFIDYFDNIAWNATFVDLGAVLPLTAETDTTFADLATSNNRGKEDALTTLTTFKQLLIDELYGTTEASSSSILIALNDFYEQCGQPPHALLPTEYFRFFANCLHLKSDMKHVLPTIYISAAFHVLFRWNRDRQLTANDIYDSSHASSALS